MQGIDLWRLCDHLSVFQVIMLVLGENPGTKNRWDIERRSNIPEDYGAIKTSIVNAIKKGLIEAEVALETEYNIDQEACGEIPNSVDIDKTLVSAQSVKDFLKARGFSTGFFFPDGSSDDEFLDIGNPCYAPKLAAAVTAWREVSVNEVLLNGKTPKQALLKWLRENANKYGLTDEDGKPNELGIEEIAKVANWNLSGGAAKTPTVVSLNPPTPKKGNKNNTENNQEDDQAIPF